MSLGIALLRMKADVHDCASFDGQAPSAPAPVRQRRPPFPAHGMVYSPCCNVCSMDEASGYCRGCQRTLAEIARWARMSDTEKLAVWRQLDEREARTRQLDQGQPR